MCYLYSVKCLLVNILDLQNVETSLVGEAKLGSICGDDRNKFIMHVINYLKLCSCINKIEKKLLENILLTTCLAMLLDLQNIWTSLGW